MHVQVLPMILSLSLLAALMLPSQSTMLQQTQLSLDTINTTFTFSFVSYIMYYKQGHTQASAAVHAHGILCPMGQTRLTR